MPGLTFAQLFGTNATLDLTTPSNPKLVIPLEAIKDDNTLGLTGGLGIANISQITDTTKDAWAAKILYALVLRHYQKHPSDNTDDTNPVYITNGGKRSITRNNVGQFAYQLTLNAYKNDTLGSLIDTDDLT